MSSTWLLVLNCLLLAVACSSEEESVSSSSSQQGLTTALHIQATQAAIEQSFTQCPQETRDAIANMSWQQDTLASTYRDATGNWQHCMRDPGQTNAQAAQTFDANYASKRDEAAAMVCDDMGGAAICSPGYPAQLFADMAHATEDCPVHQSGQNACGAGCRNAGQDVDPVPATCEQQGNQQCNTWITNVQHGFVYVGTAQIPVWWGGPYFVQDENAANVPAATARANEWFTAVKTKADQLCNDADAYYLAACDAHCQAPDCTRTGHTVEATAENWPNRTCNITFTYDRRCGEGFPMVSYTWNNHDHAGTPPCEAGAMCPIVRDAGLE